MLQGGIEEHNPHSHANTFDTSSQYFPDDLLTFWKALPQWSIATSIQIKVLYNSSLIYILYMSWPANNC